MGNGSHHIFKPLSGDYELISEVICEEKTKRFPLLNMFIRDEECHTNTSAASESSWKYQINQYQWSTLCFSRGLKMWDNIQIHPPYFKPVQTRHLDLEKSRVGFSLYLFFFLSGDNEIINSWAPDNSNLEKSCRETVLSFDVSFNCAVAAMTCQNVCSEEGLCK